MWFLKLLVFIWPFLKEMVLGEQTLRQAALNNKVRVLVICIIVLSLGLNAFTIPRLVGITQQHLDLVKTHKETETKCQAKPSGTQVTRREQVDVVREEKPVVFEPIGKTPVGKKSSSANHQASAEAERLRQVREKFKEIQRAEEESQ